MRCAALVGVVALALAAPAYGADTSPALWKAYTDRFLEMESTAAAHVELARWCEANGLADRAKKHYEEAVAFDPDHAGARAALGFVRRGTAWVPASEAGPAPKAATPTVIPQVDPLAAEVLDIQRRFLIPSRPDLWAEGQERILMMRDPGAAGPIARVLGAGGVEQRKLAVEALGAIPGREATRRLVRFILKDRSESVYTAALESLRLRGAAAGVPELTRALSGSKKSRRRAAYALGELHSWRAVPALIGHLKAPEARVRAAPGGGAGRHSGSGAYIAVGRVVTYVKDAKPVVAEAAVAWDPVIGSVITGSVLSVSNPRVTARRTIIKVIAPQPMVRDALKKITGQDFGYEQAEWRNWYARLKREQPGS